MNNQIPSQEAMSFTPRDLYPLLIAGKEIRIHCPDLRTFNSLRVALAKQHQLMVAIGGSEQSLISKYDPAKHTALYKLDQRKPGIRFTILTVEEATAESETAISGELGAETSLILGVTDESQVCGSVVPFTKAGGSQIGMSESRSEEPMCGDIPREIHAPESEEATETAGLRQDTSYSRTDS